MTETRCAEQVDQLNLYLIKPSKYDDDGYVIRHWKGVLPSNTLACLYGLSEDLRERKVFGEKLRWNIKLIDETVERINVGKIVSSSREKRTKTVICLVGVQSNQFPRASDLAVQFCKAKIPVLLGGFHVSGSIAMLSEMPLELQLLQNAGVSLVAGEAEGKWEGILRDAIEGKLKSLYNFLHEPPDLSNIPAPRFPAKLQNRYAVKHFTTLDCGRGCPFRCSFCTVINVQGRKMRFRSVQCILQLLRNNYQKYGISYYFFTDDNFCRNKNWEAILDGIISLRETENIPIGFMTQVDTRSYEIPKFVEKASRAGCAQVFIGIESINEKNLQNASKNQNKIEDFKKMIDCYHAANISTHLSYIIGFPFDSKDSVAEDIDGLMQLGAKQASFFMLTPLPGSEDYGRFLKERKVVDSDLNNFDTFHPTFKHNRMQGAEWFSAYEAAWKIFYSLENMKRVLKQTPSDKFWDVFMNFVWYKNAIQVEGGHPMLNGFVRLKHRKDRRPIYPTESRWIYFKRRVKDLANNLSQWIKLIFELEELWLATRQRSPVEEKVLSEFLKLQKGTKNWRSLRLSEIQALYRSATNALQQHSLNCVQNVKIPPRFWIWLNKWNAFSDYLTHSRFPMENYWRVIKNHVRRGRVDQIHPFQVAFMIWLEGVLFTRFLFSLVRQAVHS